MHLYGLLPLLRETEDYRRLRAQAGTPRFARKDVPPRGSHPLFRRIAATGCCCSVMLIVADPERAGSARRGGTGRHRASKWPACRNPISPDAGPQGAANESMIARAQLASSLALPQRRTGIDSRRLGARHDRRDAFSVRGGRGRDRPEASSTVMRPATCSRNCDSMGYERVEFVTQRGQMSARGGIIDVFPPIPGRAAIASSSSATRWRASGCSTR